MKSTTLSLALQNRERDLRQQLDEKRARLDAGERDAGRKVGGVIAPVQSEPESLQQDSILALEARQKEATALIASLQEKLASVEKRPRRHSGYPAGPEEHALQKELADKEQAWSRGQQALQDALDSQKKTSSQDNLLQAARIAELEKIHAEAEKYILSLRDKLVLLRIRTADVVRGSADPGAGSSSAVNGKGTGMGDRPGHASGETGGLDASIHPGPEDSRKTLFPRNWKRTRNRPPRLSLRLQAKLDSVEADRRGPDRYLARPRSLSGIRRLTHKQAAWERIQTLASG